MAAVARCIVPSAKAVRWLCAGALACSVTACLPYKERIWIEAPLEQHSLKETSSKRIRSGDVVRARKVNGKTYRFRVYKADPDGFVGMQGPDKRYRIEYRELEWLEVQRDEWDYVVLGLPIRM